MTIETKLSSGATDNAADWFFPDWAANALNSRPLKVRDTDSALGRYNLTTKEIGLKDLARVHGHLCDGLVIAFVMLSGVFGRLFPDGVVDRTDLRLVSKNGPCWVDVGALMTGARINFQTLRIDASMGNGFIVQRVSTKKAFRVQLNAGVFPEDVKVLEAKIRGARAEGLPVSAQDIDRIEELHNALSLKILTTPLDELLKIEEVSGFEFVFSDMFGGRGDIMNKDMPRT